MVTLSRTEWIITGLGVFASLISWPIGDAVGSVGKVLITAWAIGALAVSLFAVIVDYGSIDRLAIGAIRKEVFFAIGFGIFALIVMALTADLDAVF